MVSSGPMSVPSLMIPSSMCWACFLKARNEVYATFQQFKRYHKPKRYWRLTSWLLRYDNSPQYNSSQFDKFHRDERIEHQLTTTYTPQQRGGSEMMNMIVMEMAGCLMFEMDLPKHFWVEGVNISLSIKQATCKGSQEYNSLWGLAGCETICAPSQSI